MAHVIAISGLMGAGKSAAAEYLASTHGYRRVSFAGALKKACAELFGWDYEMVLGATPESRAWREQPDPFWSGVFGRDITPRWALQFVGTELVRNHLHENFWAAHTENTIRNTIARGQSVVIDDLRFQNENDVIRRLGGARVWVVRGSLQTLTPAMHTLATSYDPEVIATAFADHKANTNAHASEVEWMSRGRLNYDYLIVNDASIDEFFQQIEFIHTTAKYQQHIAIN